VVDQFEEVFTSCQDMAERDRFVAGLCAIAQDGTDRRVVLGIRADFIARCARHPALVAAMSERTILIGPLRDKELREAITGPAALAGLSVERALITQVLNDADGQPGALPLISHALLETWRQRRSTTLTLEGYLATGGVSDAIQCTAESVYAGLSPRQQHTARQVFIRLVALGEGTEDTRRRVPRTTLDLPDVDVVLPAMIEARLVTASSDTSSGDTVELAHEALIRAWPRMQDWLTEDRDGLRTHTRLAEATRGWEELGRDVDALYRGTRLVIAQEWLHRNGSDVLTRTERDFLTVSAAAELGRARCAVMIVGSRWR